MAAMSEAETAATALITRIVLADLIREHLSGADYLETLKDRLDALIDEQRMGMGAEESIVRAFATLRADVER